MLRLYLGEAKVPCSLIVRDSAAVRAADKSFANCKFHNGCEIAADRCNIVDVYNKWHYMHKSLNAVLIIN
jgi:hypothetical protein